MTRLRASLLALFTLVCPIPARGEPAGLGGSERVIDYPDGGVSLGTGWNSASGSKTAARCIIFKEASDETQDKSMKLEQVTDKDSLMRELNVSVEFQAKTIAGLGASAKAEFANKIEVQNEHSTFAVHAKVHNGATFADAPDPAPGGGSSIDLAPRYKELATTDPGTFYKACGDSYVSALFSGAELTAVLSFYTTSVSERTQLHTSLKASGWGFDASGSVTQIMQQYSSRQALNILYHASGGAGSPLPTDQAGLIQRIQSLPNDAATAPKTWSLGLRRYDDLPGWPNMRLGWSFADLEAAVGQYQRLATLYFNIYPILANPDKYVIAYNVSTKSIKELQDDLSKRMNSLASTIKGCLVGGGACKPKSEDLVADYEYRLQLPVPRGSFAADSELAKTKADIARLEAEIAALPERVLDPRLPPLALDLISHDKLPRVPNPARAAKSAELARTEALLISLEANYPVSLAEAIHQQWIHQIAIDRCRADVTSPLCLDNRALDDYRSRAHELVAGCCLSAPANPIGSTPRRLKVYGQ